MSVYFPGGPADTETTEGTLFGESFYFPLALHMHNLAKAKSLEVKSADLETCRVNLGMK